MKTWGEFKKEVEEQGVMDNHLLNWIDVGSFWRDDDEPPPRIKVENEDGKIKISNA